MVAVRTGAKPTNRARLGARMSECLGTVDDMVRVNQRASRVLSPTEVTGWLAGVLIMVVGLALAIALMPIPAVDDGLGPMLSRWAAIGTLLIDASGFLPALVTIAVVFIGVRITPDLFGLRADLAARLRIIMSIGSAGAASVAGLVLVLGVIAGVLGRAAWADVIEAGVVAATVVLLTAAETALVLVDDERHRDELVKEIGRLDDEIGGRPLPRRRGAVVGLLGWGIGHVLLCTGGWLLIFLASGDAVTARAVVLLGLVAPILCFTWAWLFASGSRSQRRAATRWVLICVGLLPALGAASPMVTVILNPAWTLVVLLIATFLAIPVTTVLPIRRGPAWLPSRLVDRLNLARLGRRRAAAVGELGKVMARIPPPPSRLERLLAVLRPGRST
jgi:hypothetical protein